MTQRKAHEIKAGDRINGVEVFDSLRRTIGGYYIPMVDGSRMQVATPDTLVQTE
ncbi:hypothetical protein [Rhodopirellula sp. SWK7]|uniref:hypothetical protein n=1 Tax=Rhodopirellula sp. SWK7 TaxID=595460 RepID=UPI0002BDC172|nr:hypothetical protein [Rhodopirellula sp. SWK7]EMI43799.1 hypothetical protein RRSWK_03649 [Rhodopirellula sp. SWK7]